MSQTNPVTISKRRLMLYKAIQEFPENQRIRNALLRTYASAHIQVAAKEGIYIGYNRADELFALELDTELRQTGVNVWLDQIDIEPDEDWEYAISNRINHSGMMILVLSPHAIEDEQLQQEAITFLESGKIVIPVVHETYDMDALDLILPPIDFSESFERGLQFLLQGITIQSAVNV
jgi:TIR domain